MATTEGFTGEVWQSCTLNCGAHCALKFHVKGGKLDWVESDTLPETDGAPQMRACLRGRSMRYWLNAPERLNYPMKRVGKRGEGKFERISWDEAYDLLAGEIKRVVKDYGNEAVYVSYATGIWPYNGSPFERLMNCYGGYLRFYGDYSSAQLQAACFYTYGDLGYYSASAISEAAQADLVLLFGNSPTETRMGGASASWEFTRAREAGDFKLITIDPRHNETAANNKGEWIAIRPGTDAALVAGIAYVLITEELVDQDFLDTYCIGYDETSMPAGAPAHASYKDYILGFGTDGISKTPVWASSVTGIPVSRIVELAHEIANADRVFVAQGWGPQRHDNGELAARAICMLPLLTGNFGLPGTNSGVRERFIPFLVDDPPVGESPVQAAIPAFMWSAAVEHGPELTAENGGVRGADRLQVPIKLIVNHAGNCLTNQHANINRTHDILSDETKCEFIVVSDLHLTDTARYADLLLPDIAHVEQDNLLSSGNGDMVRGLVRGHAWAADCYERKTAQEVCEEVAKRLGIAEEFARLSEQASDQARLDYTHERMEQARLHAGGSATRSNDAALPDGFEYYDVPTFEQIDEAGLWRTPYRGETVAYRAFREDPLANPLPTPSGKVEIYSQRLAELAEVYEYADDQIIHPLPIYAPEAEGYGSPAMRDFPFQLVGYHARQRTHSSFGNVEEIESVSPHEMLVNPIDAHALDLHARERVVVENDRGAIVVRVRITPRVMPGVLALPQGAWHKADMYGDKLDWGGCINTLTSDRPTALARGNAQHTILVRVRKLEEGEAHG